MRNDERGVRAAKANIEVLVILAIAAVFVSEAWYAGIVRGDAPPTIGDRAVAAFDIDIRTTPPSVASPIVAHIVAGTEGTLVEGPRAGDGANWWLVYFDNGRLGWAPEAMLGKPEVSATVSASLPSAALPTFPSPPSSAVNTGTVNMSAPALPNTGAGGSAFAR